MELMGFIDENEIDLRPLASRERLYRAHLDRLVAIGALVDTLHDADGVDVLGLECRDGLIDQAECANTKATRFPLSSARWMICTAVRVLPKPVGAEAWDAACRPPARR